jgi:hypothetical protein
MTIAYIYEDGTNTLIFRVKLPKSFLAVNLSESHTFRRKGSSDAGDSSVDEMKKSGEPVDKNSAQGQQDEAVDHLYGNESRHVDMPPS